MDVKPPSIETVAASYVEPNAAYAQWWRRVAALAVDSVVFTFTLWLAIQMWTWSLFEQMNFQVLPGGDWTMHIPDPVGQLVALVVVIALFGPIYFGFQESGRYSASFGKRLFSIKVVRTDASRLSYCRAALRAFIHSVPGIGLVGDLIQPFTKRHQTLHDYLTNSVVIRAEGVMEGTPLTKIKKLVRYVLKWLVYLFVALLGLVITALLILVAINWKDEALRPEVAKVFEWAPSPTAFDDNGYIVLLGQDAAPDVDPAAVGKAILQSQLNEYEKRRRDGQLLAGDSTNVMPATAFTKYLCDYSKQNCVEHYLSIRSSIANASPQISTLEQRLRLIAGSTRFEVVVTPLTQLGGTNWRYLTDGSDLVRAMALFELADGKYTEGIQHLVSNALFSRRVLQQATTRYSYLIAVGMVNKDLRFISEVVQKYPSIVSKYIQELQPLADPVAGSEFSVERAFEDERARVLRPIREMLNSPTVRWWPRFVARLFAMPKATENLIFTEFEKYIHLAKSSADTYDAEVERTGLKLSAANEFGILANFHPVNPIGKILSQANFYSADYFGIIEKHHDLNGHIRLLALQLRLANKDIPLASIPETLRSLPEEFNDPYTNKPMQWDVASSEIRFLGHQKASQNLAASRLYAIPMSKWLP